MYLLILILGITIAICVCSGDVLTPPYTVMLCSFGMLIETPVVKKDFLVSALSFHSIDTEKRSI